MILKIDLQALDSLQTKALSVKGGNQNLQDAPTLLQILKRTFAVINGTNDRALVTTMKYSLYNPVFKYVIDYRKIGFIYSVLNQQHGLVTGHVAYRLIYYLNCVAHNIYSRQHNLSNVYV